MKNLLQWWTEKMLGRSTCGLENLRKTPRLKLQLPVNCSVAGHSSSAELKDLSKGGLRLKVGGPVAVGTLLDVFPSAELGWPGRQKVRGRVVWSRFLRPHHEIGVLAVQPAAWLAESWMGPLLRHLDGPRIRRHSRRLACRLRAQIWERESLTLAPGVCLNLSLGGCLLQSQQPLQAGKTLEVSFEPGQCEFHRAVVLPGSQMSGRESLSHLRFLPGQERERLRLRSLLSSLCESGCDVEDEAELDPDILAQLSRPRPAFHATGLSERTLKSISIPSVPQFPVGVPLWKLLGRGGPAIQRLISLRCPSLWAARCLSLRKT